MVFAAQGQHRWKDLTNPHGSDGAFGERSSRATSPSLTEALGHSADAAPAAIGREDEGGSDGNATHRVRPREGA